MVELNNEKYYHVILERSISQTGTKPNYSCEVNLTKDHILNAFVKPFKMKRTLVCGGSIYEPSELIGINFYFTPNMLDKKAHRTEISSLLYNSAEDVTREFFDEAGNIEPDGESKKEESPTELSEGTPHIGAIYNMYSGDIFQNIQDSTIVNRANVRKAFNKLGPDKKTKEALIKVAEFIDKSGNPAAGALFNNLTEEMNKPTPDKSRLRSFSSEIKTLLPTITELAKIVSLLS